MRTTSGEQDRRLSCVTGRLRILRSLPKGHSPRTSLVLPRSLEGGPRSPRRWGAGVTPSPGIRSILARHLCWFAFYADAILNSTEASRLASHQQYPTCTTTLDY